MWDVILISFVKLFVANEYYVVPVCMSTCVHMWGISVLMLGASLIDLILFLEKWSNDFLTTLPWDHRQLLCWFGLYIGYGIWTPVFIYSCKARDVLAEPCPSACIRWYLWRYHLSVFGIISKFWYFSYFIF